MSVQTQINRISLNISECFDAVETKGGTLPSVLNSDNLPDAIDTISSSADPYDGSYHFITSNLMASPPRMFSSPPLGATPNGTGVQFQINRIKDNIEASYSKVDEKGGTLPSIQNSDNLADAILSISGGGAAWDESYHVERIFPIPSVSGSYTYNKSEQTANITGYDATYMTQSGTTSATNARAYTVTWTLKDTTYNQWSDGSKTAKSGTWTIAKLSNPISADVTSLDWGTGTGDKYINITNNGDGTLSASSTDTTNFPVSVSGNVVTVGHASAADASGTVTISSSATSNTEAGSITVSCTSSKPACVTADTLITLADGRRKRIDEITYEDELLTYRLETGEFEAQKPSKIYYDGEAVFNVLHLFFDNGSAVKMMTNHGFLNCTRRTFSDITLYNYEEYIGDEFMAEDGSRTKLVSGGIKEEQTSAWAILTKYSENFISNGIVSMTGDRFEVFEIDAEMKYDTVKMLTEIERYGLLKYEDYADKISEEDFYETNCPYYGVPLGKGIIDNAFIEYYIPIVTSTHVVPKE